jgi:cytochrome c oxidase cbb3-type subunit 3
MATTPEKDPVTGRDTTGHEWDGIRELNTPLPKWWLYTFYVTIVFAAVYAFLYPSVPWIHSHWKGTLGYTQRTALEASMTAAASEQAALRDRIRDTPLETIRNDQTLVAFAQAGGRAMFNENCAPCHRPGGAGAKGYPNLADDDWLWGGSLAQIQQTITHGIRNADPDSHQMQMPRFGLDGILNQAQISDVADFVLSLSGHAGEASADAIGRGSKIFADNCVACHGPEGRGNPEMGAKNLANGIWLYGGGKATIVDTITKARNSSMPAWGARLDPTTIKMLTIYVHTLGGGQ